VDDAAGVHCPSWQNLMHIATSPCFLASLARVLLPTWLSVDDAFEAVAKLTTALLLGGGIMLHRKIGF
jgi:hypothetical protein